MSQTGPPADAKQAQAAALQELEAAQKRKRAIDTSLVRPRHWIFEGDVLMRVGQPRGIYLCI